MEIVFFIVGAVFAAVGGYIIVDFRRFKRAAVSRKGQVVAYAVHRSRSRQNGPSETYAPVVQYAVDGQSHQFTAGISTSQVKYQIGETVPILVSRTDPSRARLDSAVNILLGGGFLVLGLGAMATFFAVFQFDAVSVGIAVVVIAVVFFKAIAMLNRLQVHSLSELKNKLTTLQHTGLTQTSKQDLVISDAAAFKRHVKRRQTAPVWLLAIFIVAGLAVTAGGVHFGIQRAEFLQTAVSGHGIIVKFNQKTSSSDNGSNTVYYPVVEFQPQDALRTHGKIRFQHNIGTSHPSFHRGDNVRVLYSPNNPDEAIIDQGWMNYFGPLLMVALGSIFTIVGASLIIKQRRKTGQSQLKLDF